MDAQQNRQEQYFRASLLEIMRNDANNSHNTIEIYDKYEPNIRRFFRTGALSTAAVLLTSPTLFAADASVLQRYVIDGGWPMFLIGALILCLIALCVFNAMNLTRTKFVPDDLKAGLMDHMINCRVRSAIELGASHP